MAADARGNDKKVVLAVGCFDLLHVGHVRYLQEARSEGDLLVVGVNDDNSVAAFRGKGHPLLREDERAELVAAVEVVDLVVVFEGKRIVPLIDFLAPDVYCPGSESAGGAKDVKSEVGDKEWGTRVVYVPGARPTVDLFERVLERIARK